MQNKNKFPNLNMCQKCNYYYYRIRALYKLVLATDYQQLIITNPKIYTLFNKFKSQNRNPVMILSGTLSGKMS